MVPARVERTAVAPERLVSTTTKVNAVTLVTRKSGEIKSATTVTPATMNERFCVDSQARRTYYIKK